MAVPAGSPDNPVIIHIKPGTYKELIYIQREKRFFRLVGENALKTILSYDLNANLTGRDNDGRRVGVAAENIIVRNCTMKDGHGGVVIGSEVSGHCRNVFVENCHMDSPNLDRALRFKDNARRGGVIENVFMRNVEIGRVAEAILTIDFLYETGAAGPYKPVVRNVELSNVRSASSPRVMWVMSFPGAVVDDVRFVDCTFRGVETAEVMQNAGSVSFRNVNIEPAQKTNSRSTRTTWP